jgi:hypothetical protein
VVKPTIKETFPGIWADLSLDSRVMIAIVERIVSEIRPEGENA